MSAQPSANGRPYNPRRRHTVSRRRRPPAHLDRGALTLALLLPARPETERSAERVAGRFLLARCGAQNKPLEAFLSQLKEEATTMAEGYQRLERILSGLETEN